MEIRLLLAVLLCCIAAADTNAQLLKRRYSKYEFKPQFVLVQLPTNSQKVKLYTSKKNEKLANEAKKDAGEVSKKMVLDFNDNFEFCPVYYFYDTNAEQVVNKHFNNIVFDKDMNPADNLAGNAVDTEYYIVYFGYDVTTTDDYNPDDNDKDVHNGAYTTLGSNQQRLIVVDYKFKRLPTPIPRRSGVLVSNKLKKDAKAYFYNSTQKSSFYRPYAKNLSGAMLSFYNN